MRKATKKHRYVAASLLLVTWLMTGFAVDDEFSGEFRFFVKHRPTLQYYFESPLGMEDMPADYPADKVAAYYTYRNFVLDSHWSSDMEWVAVFLVVLTIAWIGFAASVKKIN
ncbi:hypothetical protein GCM10007415_33910 [Parapedobacter pyrenivorans]|uniref:Uncharacterized protein n=1 Tax=Parapedobacter pyrenivorans TaxID=1305674 RepID=A0A917HYL1_9SPHI|nr:hypothetical protein [Parapedobacter pyrenivorans]GGG95903.1 hypothetical protein GCM10007415_33910 [Parapedobacter pyrenivorans]